LDMTSDAERRLRILLVEDSPDDAYLICRSLERGGCRCAVRQTANLAELNVALSHESWDLVIADMALPGFNGHDVLRHARQSDPELPVIALSGLKKDPRGPEMLAAGASEFVGKDRLADLSAAVQRLAVVRA
ncbi:MAG: response regulator, partial [Betaproteobacteria bacterium]|nr:response regulator [Betaproteobacteria bacterium]